MTSLDGSPYLPVSVSLLKRAAQGKHVRMSYAYALFSAPPPPNPLYLMCFRLKSPTTMKLNETAAVLSFQRSNRKQEKRICWCLWCEKCLCSVVCCFVEGEETLSPGTAHLLQLDQRTLKHPLSTPFFLSFFLNHMLLFLQHLIFHLFSHVWSITGVLS